jgi:hypothetical protein
MKLEGKNKLLAIALVLVVAAGIFYAGAQYEKNKLSSLGLLKSSAPKTSNSSTKSKTNTQTANPQNTSTPSNATNNTNNSTGTANSVNNTGNTNTTTNTSGY